MSRYSCCVVAHTNALQETKGEILDEKCWAIKSPLASSKKGTILVKENDGENCNHFVRYFQRPDQHLHKCICELALNVLQKQSYD